MIKRVTDYRFVFAVLCAFCAPSLCAQQDSSNLEEIQSLITATKQQLERNLESSERLEQELKLAELEIAETATQLNATQSQLVVTREEIRVLNQQKRDTETRISTQQNLLAAQIKSAYMAGNYDYAKMLFNQTQASKMERVLQYYQYLNQARQSQIDEFRSLIETLETIKVDLDAQQSQLSVLIDEQQQQSSLLSEQQQTRFAKLRELNQQIETDQARVERLEQQEKDLVAAIEAAELAAQRAAQRAQEQGNVKVALNGLSGMRGQLIKPTSGRLDPRFGKRRQGQVRWKGVFFRTNAGTPVNAVADGKVLYSDWLKGFGLVVIVDHGDGYMTVYGQNQAILKNAGDYVTQGDTLSLVGTSGGQTTSGLYFEIRHKGKALNPSQWIQ